MHQLFCWWPREKHKPQPKHALTMDIEMGADSALYGILKRDSPYILL